VNSVHVLVPLKPLGEAKSRLAGLLDAGERRALAAAMAEDVLAVLAAHPSLATVTLITDDPAALQLAEQYNLRVLTERDLAAQGLNDVISCGLARLNLHCSDRVLVLHGDLPCLHGADIEAALGLLETTDTLVIGSDEAGVGTNLLAFSAGRAPTFEFGPDSCARHRAQAPSRASVLYRPGIALDVDEPLDLLALVRAPHVGTRTRRYLQQTGLAARLPLLPPQSWPSLREKLLAGEQPSRQEALSLARHADTAALAEVAATLRDRGHGQLITYSRKVFIPLTQLCRDVCHYCTFARTPSKIEQAYMPVEEVLALCRQGARQGCQEALFTLGEKPELRYSSARKALAEIGYASTLAYVCEVAGRVLEETGLLPHINAGCMNPEEIAALRKVSASMGIMLESASPRLCEKGMPHYGSPDKLPAARLETIELAGRCSVPMTSGILIGIGETRRERIESLLALRDAHWRHGHLQEVIVQNFRAKQETLMAAAPEPGLDELLWTIAVARLIFGPHMNIQAPPNLSPGVLPQLVAAGINDWGGVSPLTPDHVNPEAPWPHLEQLARETAVAGKFLDQRLTLYPQYVVEPVRWLDAALHRQVLNHSDAMGFARRDDWVPGEKHPAPLLESALLAREPAPEMVSGGVRDIVDRCRAGAELSPADVQRLFDCRGEEFAFLVRAADEFRAAAVGDSVSYVVNRNINYTNVCYFKCQFCAFSKGKLSENLRGRPYDISGEEIARRCSEAWCRGATEVCMQGGIHPDYTGQTYLDILGTVRATTPEMHIHAFSPLEVWQGAATLGLGVEEFLLELKSAGLNTLPGTAAEILHDDIRATLCPDKLGTAQWLAVMEAAHHVGLPTTATIMYGHIERSSHCARHLLHIRELQRRTGGFTEFVPLPFVHMEAPLYLKGRARPGPTFREAVLMHAVARLVFHGLIDNIQVSWVKMGVEGVSVCLRAGANDLGGTLMNESITRAAGAGHGQEWSPGKMEELIRRAGRRPRMRTTLYADAPAQQRMAAFQTIPLKVVANKAAGKYQSPKLIAANRAGDGGGDAGRQVFLMAACD